MTTEEFLVLLRQKEYFYILDWQKHLNDEYGKGSSLDGDMQLFMVIYELINNGFNQDDMVHIQILYAIMGDATLRVPGEIAYAINTLVSTSLQCMVYLDHDLVSFYQNKPKAVKLLDWMTRDNLKLSNLENSQLLGQKWELLESQLPMVKNEVEVIREKIKAVLAYREISGDYHWIFTDYCNKYDVGDNAYSRLGVVAALDGFLQSQVTLSPQALVRIEGYKKQIRAMQPYNWEENYLTRILPKPWSDRIMEKIKFFSLRGLSALTLSAEDNNVLAITDQVKRDQSF